MRAKELKSIPGDFQSDDVDKKKRKTESKCTKFSEVIHTSTTPKSKPYSKCSRILNSEVAPRFRKPQTMNVKSTFMSSATDRQCFMLRRLQMQSLPK